MKRKGKKEMDFAQAPPSQGYLTVDSAGVLVVKYVLIAMFPWCT